MPETKAPRSESPAKSRLPLQRPPLVLEYFHHARGQMRGMFTRDNLVSFARSMAWVVPLTILIWIYAEREQLAPAPGRVIPIDVKTSAPNRVVKLLSPVDKNIVADLAGP